MRPRLRSTLLLAFVACHATVLSAGPSLHGWLGLDHDAPGRVSSEKGDSHGGPRHALGGASHDCAACHLLSLASHHRDEVVAFSPLPTGRVLQPLRVVPPPREARSDPPSRAPPAGAAGFYTV